MGNFIYMKGEFWNMLLQVHCGICGRPEPLAHLIEGDLLVVPVLNVEEQNHAAVLVSAGQDAGIPGLDGAAYGLRGQVLKQLGVILPETHVAWMETQKHKYWLLMSSIDEMTEAKQLWDNSFHFKCVTNSICYKWKGMLGHVIP